MITADTTEQALARYNRRFDNGRYQALAVLLAADLRADRESERVADALNLITDAALEVSGHPYYVQAWLKLAAFCGQHPLAIATIDAIHAYLLIYQQAVDTRADDFELTAKALQQCYQSGDSLRAAVTCANGVHGWRGRMAYDLLAACGFLTQAAAHLLMHGNASYIREKLHAGLRRIIGALHEGLRNVDHPEQFDFSETRFPGERDRR